MGDDGESEKSEEACMPLVEPLIEWPSPENFELHVKREIESWGSGLQDLDVRHLDCLKGVDGEYTIDVTARFKAFGHMRFLCLFECKCLHRPIERADIQQLLVKMHSVGAQKGAMVSLSRYQRGAVRFAKVHGISTVSLVAANVGLTLALNAQFATFWSMAWG